VPATTPDRDTGRPPSCTRILGAPAPPRPRITGAAKSLARGVPVPVPPAPRWPRRLRGCVRTTRRRPWPGARDSDGGRGKQTHDGALRARGAGASRPPAPGPGALGLVVLFLSRGKGKRLDRAGKAKVAEAISTNLADGRVVLDNVPWTLWASSSQLRRPIHRTTGRTSPATPPWPCGIVCQCRFGWRLNALLRAKFGLCRR